MHVPNFWAGQVGLGESCQHVGWKGLPPRDQKCRQERWGWVEGCRVWLKWPRHGVPSPAGKAHAGSEGRAGVSPGGVPPRAAPQLVSSVGLGLGEREVTEH